MNLIKNKNEKLGGERREIKSELNKLQVYRIKQILKHFYYKTKILIFCKRKTERNNILFREFISKEVEYMKSQLSINNKEIEIIKEYIDELNDISKEDRKKIDKLIRNFLTILKLIVAFLIDKILIIVIPNHKFNFIILTIKKGEKAIIKLEKFNKILKPEIRKKENYLKTNPRNQDPRKNKIAIWGKIKK